MRSFFGPGGFIILLLCVVFNGFALCEMVDEYTADRNIILDLSEYTISETSPTQTVSSFEDSSFVRLFFTAYDYFDSLEYDLSITVFKSALSRRPGNFLCRMGMAKDFIGLDSFDVALTYLDSLVDEAPWDYRPLYWRAFIYNQIQMYDSALTSLKTALKLGGEKDMRVYEKCVEVYIKLKNASKAKEFAHRAIELNDSSTMAWSAFGMYFDATGHDSSAINAYTRAIKLERIPTRARLWYIYQNRAAACEDIEDYARAVHDFNRLTDWFPGYIYAWSHAGDCYYELDSIPKALRCYNRAFEEGADDNEHVLYWRARSNYDLNNDKAAYDQYWEYLKLVPDDADALYEFAWTLTNLGYAESGIEYFDKCLAVDSTYYDAIIGKAYAMGELNRFNLATDFYRQYLKYYPDDTDSWFNLGLNLWNAEKRLSALNAFDSCLKYDSTYGNAWLYKGQLLQELGRYAYGRVCLDSAEYYGADMDE